MVMHLVLPINIRLPIHAYNLLVPFISLFLSLKVVHFFSSLLPIRNTGPGVFLRALLNVLVARLISPPSNLSWYN
jgi:hypothetical protein